MKKAILATKVGMTQIFNENGALIPVTVLQAGPCVVLGFSVGMEAFGELLLINVPWSQEFSGVLRI